MTKYQRWVRAVVERYDGDGVDDMPGLTAPIKIWQVDNEPPRRREGYADLVRITSQAVKEADPTAKVLIGGLEIPFDDYRERIYEQEQLPILQELRGKGIDILDLHWFGHLDESGKLPKAIERVRSDLKQCGFENTAIWFTEMGTYSEIPATIRNINSRFNQNDSRRPRCSSGMSWLWAKELRSCSGPGAWSKGSLTFTTTTTSTTRGSSTTGSDRRSWAGNKKIAFWTYQKMTGLLQHWDGKPPEKLSLGEAVVGYRFRTAADDRAVLALWQEQR